MAEAAQRKQTDMRPNQNSPTKPGDGKSFGASNVRRFTADEKSCIAHAIDHLKANKIADDDYPHSGWYYGNREQFIKRHKKALAVLRGFISPNTQLTKPREN
jgi:hypothetical protein